MHGVFCRVLIRWGPGLLVATPSEKLRSLKNQLIWSRTSMSLLRQLCVKIRRCLDLTRDEFMLKGGSPALGKL